MKVGLIGLGKMGEAIAFRLIKAGHKVFAYDPNVDATKKVKRLGAEIVGDIVDLPKKAKIIWLMVPAGKIVDQTIKKLKTNLKKEAIIIDGGNSNFKDSIRRAKSLEKQKIYFLDCGTSGGLHGKKMGFSLMVGGDAKIYKKMQPVFKAISAKDGYAYMGPSGSGHYVKMIHNGIEYALLQSYAEGFNLLKNGKFKNLNLEKISNVWGHGSVIRSWILELLHNVFKKDQDLKNISGEIGENLTGRWSLQEAKKQKIPLDLVERSLKIRELSRESGGNYATKIVSMLRNQFGGHPLKILKRK
jgi:6-phosphogluconate dehydrogenase